MLFTSYYLYIYVTQKNSEETAGQIGVGTKEKKRRRGTGNDEMFLNNII